MTDASEPQLPGGEKARWRRKTWQEMQADRRRRRWQGLNPFLPLCVAAVLVTAITAADVFVGNPRHRRPPVPLSDALSHLPLMFVLVFVVVYFLQVVVGAFTGRTRLTICTRCYDIGVRTGNDRCPCGGHLDDADRWTHNRCPACDYDLRSTSDVCPECGTPVPGIKWPRTPPRAKWSRKRQERP